MFGLSSDLTERLARERPVVVMGRGHSGTRVLAWALEALGICMGTLEEKPGVPPSAGHLEGLRRLAAARGARVVVTAPFSFIGPDLVSDRILRCGLRTRLRAASARSPA